MRRKDLAKGVTGLLQPNEELIESLSPELQQESKEFRESRDSRKPGRPKGSGNHDYFRMTFAVNKEELVKFRYIGRRLGVTTKDLLEKAMREQREKFERKYGPIVLSEIDNELNEL